MSDTNDACLSELQAIQASISRSYLLVRNHHAPYGGTTPDPFAREQDAAVDYVGCSQWDWSD